MTKKCKALKTISLRGCSSASRTSLLLLKDLGSLETINLASVPACDPSLVLALVEGCRGLRSIACTPFKNEDEAAAIVRAWGKGAAAMRTTSVDCTFELSKAWLCDQRRRRFWAGLVSRGMVVRLTINETKVTHETCPQVRRRHASRTIQIVFRRHAAEQAAKRERERRRAAAIIQIAFRRTAGRWRTDGGDAGKVVPLPNLDDENHSELVYSRHLSYLDRFSNPAMFLLEKARVEKEKRRLAEDRRRRMEGQAAFTIQSAWHHSKAMPKARQCMKGFRTMRTASIIVQKLARGRAARNLYARMMTQAAMLVLRTTSLRSMLKRDAGSGGGGGDSGGGNHSATHSRIVLHAASVIIQNAYRQYSERCRIIDRFRRNQAARVIQKAFRDHIVCAAARAHLLSILGDKQTKAAMRIQDFFRRAMKRWLEKLWDTTTQSAAKRIQRSYRARKMERRKRAVRLIQRRLRGANGRRRFRVVRSMREAAETLRRQKEGAAEMIQRFARCYFAKQTFELKLYRRNVLRMQREAARRWDAAIVIQRNARVWVGYSRFLVACKRLAHHSRKRKRAATAIAQWYRFTPSGLAFYLRRLRAAISVQRSYRCYKFRMIVRRKVRLARLRAIDKVIEAEEQAQKGAAAKRIQAVVRGINDRVWIVELRRRKNLEAEEKRRKEKEALIIDFFRKKKKYATDNFAASQCQKVVRSWLLRRELERQRNIEEAARQIAIVKIQIAFKKKLWHAAFKKRCENAKENTKAPTVTHTLQSGFCAEVLLAVHFLFTHLARRIPVFANMWEATMYNLQRGDSVMARWNGYEREYPGIIFGINAPGNDEEGETYEIRYKDSVVEHRVKRDMIRFIKRSEVKEDVS